jgi:hypothetical protein
MIFERTTKIKEGELHHLEGRIIKMEVVPNLGVGKKLHMKIMQEEHDVPMVGHHREQTIRVAIGKRFY